MALRCKEGDLAILLSGRFIGYVVKVVEYVGNKWVHNAHTGRSTYGINLWRVEGIPSITGRGTVRRDRHLQPIRPPRVAKTTETKQEIEA